MVHPLGSFAYTWPYLAAVVLGYLFGSVPFGLLLTRVAGLGDIRKVGSGNIGATNVLRTGRKGLALATLLLDVAKGALAFWLGGRFGQDMAILAGGAALLGHVFPIWLRFRGGKGVATALGVLLMLSWPVGVLSFSTWLAVALSFRYASLASIVAAVSVSVYAAWLTDAQSFELALFITALVLATHCRNFWRLVRGEEPKIGQEPPAGA